jgi:hypothetical protein
VQKIPTHPEYSAAHHKSERKYHRLKEEPPKRMKWKDNWYSDEARNNTHPCQARQSHSQSTKWSTPKSGALLQFLLHMLKARPKRIMVFQVTASQKKEQ